MMLLIITIILALGLLAGIIYLLRNQRLRALNEAAEREQPLPPLPSDFKVNTDLDSEETNLDEVSPEDRDPVTGETDNLNALSTGTAPQARPPAGTDAFLTPSGETGIPDTEKSETLPNSAMADTPPPVEPAEDAGPDILAESGAEDSTDWKAECLRLRQSGDYEAALAQCDRGWPQWQSYQQAALVIRAALRDLLDKHTLEDGTCPASRRAIWLERLYTRAAQASFLHDKVSGLPDPNWQALAKRFSQQEVAALPMRWRELGYKKLRLLNQSDCKALVELFGEPDKHLSAREFHRERW